MNTNALSTGRQVFLLTGSMLPSFTPLPPIHTTDTKAPFTPNAVLCLCWRAHVCCHWPNTSWLDKHSALEDGKWPHRGLCYIFYYRNPTGNSRKQEETLFPSQDQLCFCMKHITGLLLSKLAESQSKSNADLTALSPPWPVWPVTIPSPLEAGTQQQHFSKASQIFPVSGQHKQTSALRRRAAAVPAGWGLLSSSQISWNILFMTERNWTFSYLNAQWSLEVAPHGTFTIQRWHNTF